MRELILVMCKLPPTYSPGHYEHDVVKNRHVEVMGSFGGNAQIKEAVFTKCTNGNTDKVNCTL